MSDFFLGKPSVDLKLTKREQYIIQSDMSLFACEALEAFCNRIIVNHHKDFICTEWKDLSKRIRIGKADQKIGTKVNLQKEAYFILADEISINFPVDYFEKYERKLSTSYVNHLLKEYVNMQLCERERIYFKNTFDAIKNAKDTKKQLQITTGKRYFQCSVYDIMVESGNTYIICKSAEIKDGVLSDKWEYASFRFRYITNVKNAISEKRDLDISEHDEIEIQDKIFSHGIQFFLDNVEIIKVRFTDDGLKKYNSIRNLRPFEYCGWDIDDKAEKVAFALNKKRDDLNNIKTFKCTRKQIEYYLFQFGADAEILEPKDLREEFLKEYKKAVEVYK